MKIVLIGNYLPDGQPSMQRFAANMNAGLAAEGINVTTIRPSVIFGRVGARGVGLKKWAGYLDKFVLFPRTLKKFCKEQCSHGGQVVFHVCDHSNAMYVHTLGRVPHVVTCHDLFAVRSALGEIPRNPTRWSGRRLQGMILQGLRTAQMIVCDSEATRRDVLRLAQSDPERVKTAWLSLVSDHWQPSRAKPDENWRTLVRSGGDASPLGTEVKGFVLHVGGEAWYKNRCGVVRIFSHLEGNSGEQLCLIMVGPPLDVRSLDVINSKPGLADRVRCIQNVSDADLAVLYRAADALLFPSLDEGFGWPVLEAHACGCRVVASRRGSLPEVGGTAVSYIDPENEEAAAKVLEGVITQHDEQRKRAYSEALSNASRFSLQATIQNYVDFYERLVR